jgi:hypothetical protein
LIPAQWNLLSLHRTFMGHSSITVTFDLYDVQVSFAKPHGGWINWEANCNGYFANVHINAGRLKLAGIGSTAVGCLGGNGREDSWLEHFFGSDPRWRWRGARLALSSDGDEMVLEERQSQSPSRH